MMKRKILAVTIPVVGCITVVGSGFSAWYFDAAVSGSDGLSASLNTHVTEKIDSMGEGVLTFTDSNKNEALNNKYLILDQGGMNNDVETVGIMIADGAVNAVQELSRKYSFTVRFNGSTLTLDKIYDAHMKLSVSVEIELKDKLPEYVTLKEGAKMTVSYQESSGLPPESVDFTKTSNKWTATYTLDAEKHSGLFDKDISNFKWTFEIDLSTSEALENSLFKYVDDKKPTDEGTYNQMVNDLGLGDVGKPATLGFVTTAKIGTVA